MVVTRTQIVIILYNIVIAMGNKNNLEGKKELNLVTLKIKFSLCFKGEQGRKEIRNEKYIIEIVN